MKNNQAAKKIGMKILWLAGILICCAVSLSFAASEGLTDFCEIGSGKTSVNKSAVNLEGASCADTIKNAGNILIAVTGNSATYAKAGSEISIIGTALSSKPAKLTALEPQIQNAQPAETKVKPRPAHERPKYNQTTPVKLLADNNTMPQAVVIPATTLKETNKYFSALALTLKINTPAISAYRFEDIKTFEYTGLASNVFARAPPQEASRMFFVANVPYNSTSKISYLWPRPTLKQQTAQEIKQKPSVNNIKTASNSSKDFNLAAGRLTFNVQTAGFNAGLFAGRLR